MSRPALLLAVLVLVLAPAGCAQIFGLDGTHRDDGDGGPPGDAGDDDDDDDAGPDDAGVDAPLAPCGVPDATEPCYTGPEGTLGNGPCEEGTRTCLDTGFWGACEDQVLPELEICNNGEDEDCSGVPDDLGGEGSIDFPGNGVDDDCDGTEDNVVPPCDEALPSNATEAVSYARALGACVDAAEGSTDWGLIDAQLTFTDGTGTVNPIQRSIRPALGATLPREGTALVVLSNGTAAAPGQTDPAYATFEGGTDGMTTSNLPPDWLAAHGNVQPPTPGCPPTGTMAFDPVMLTIRMRAPTNAHAFRLRTNYFSSDYPEFMCAAYNDPFIVLLDSTSTSNPADKNLATVTDAGGTPYVMNANVTLAGDYLRVCRDISNMCPLNPPITEHYDGCVDDAELIGTGFDVIVPPTLPGMGTCGSDEIQVGAGTGWMITQGNVVGGEVITLRIATWDNGDHIYDSMALVDGFEWLPDPVVAGTTPDL